MLLQDKVAVIYEAGGAIGSAVARAVAAEGATLFSPGATWHRSKRSPRTSLPPAEPPRRPRSTPSTSRPGDHRMSLYVRGNRRDSSKGRPKRPNYSADGSSGNRSQVTTEQFGEAPPRRLPSIRVIPIRSRRGRKPAMNDPQQSAKSTTATDKTFTGLTDEERGAMKERAQELKAAVRRGPRADKADGESAVLAKIAEMPELDRALGERLHAIIKASAPALSPKTWYGMPAYAKDGKVVCFFQSADKFKSRYATFGFSDEANLDDGTMWPTSFALTKLTAAEEARIGALVKKAVS